MVHQNGDPEIPLLVPYQSGITAYYLLYFFWRGRRELRGGREERERGITHTRPFNPTVISNDIFFPSASRTVSRTVHVGELNSLKIYCGIFKL
jgi:hypothetical protein